MNLNFDCLRKNPLGVFAMFFVLGFLLYGRILNAPFVYDDHELLLANPLVKNLSSPWHDWQTAGTKLITLWTFALNYQWGGQNPVGYHLVNVLLHIANAWLLYQLILVFYKSPRLKESLSYPQWIAFFSALVFLCHPLQTESVSFIWQRSELLNAFFYLLSMWCYVTARLKKQAIYFLFMTLSFGLGFYSKGMILSLPLMLLVLEYALFDVLQGGKWLFKTTFRLLGSFIILYEIALVAHFDLSKFFFTFMSVTGTQISNEFIYTQFVVLVRYILLVFFPFQQNLDYDVPIFWNFGDAQVMLSLLGLVVILGIALWLWRKNRLMSVGIFWFFIVLLPNIFLGGRDPMVEHRLYLSIGGFALLLGLWLNQLITDRKVLLYTFGTLVLVLSVLTFARNAVWQSPQLLFEDTVRKSPAKSRPAMMLGTVYLTQNRLVEAAAMFQRAIQLDPSSTESFNNLGLIYLEQGRIMDAEGLFEKAIQSRKKFPPAYINLGYIALDMGDDDRAEDLFLKAIGAGGKDTGLTGLGNVYLSRRDFVKAQLTLEDSVRLNPFNYKAQLSLGNVFLAQKNYSQAITAYQKALALKPDLKDALLRLSFCYKQTGDMENARYFLEKVGPRDRNRTQIRYGAGR